MRSMIQEEVLRKSMGFFTSTQLERLLKNMLQDEASSDSFYDLRSDCFSSISQKDRIFAGLCMIMSGQTGQGLRELSVVIELSGPKFKPVAILYLLYGLDIAGYSSFVLNYISRAEKAEKWIQILGGSADFSQFYEGQAFLKLTRLSKTNVSSIESRISQTHLKLSRCLKDTIGPLYSEVELCNSIELIFNCIISLAPSESFVCLDRKRNELRVIFQYIRFGEKWTQNLRLPSMAATIKAYISMRDGKFQESYLDFLEVLSLNSKGLQNSLSSISLRSISLLASQCLVRLEHSNEEAIHLMLRQIMLLSETLSVEKEQECGRLEFYFHSLTLLYVELSYKRSISSKNREDIERSALDMIEVLRKLIIISTLKSDDDISLTKVYSYILTTIVLCGGLHVKIIWFFNFVKDFFSIQLSFKNLIQVQFEIQRIEQFQPFCQKIVHELILIEEGVTQDELERIKEGNLVASFFTPFFFITGEEDSPYLQEDTDKPNSLESCLLQTDELLELWLQSYKSYRGEIPNEIQLYLSTFYQS